MGKSPLTLKVFIAIVLNDIGDSLAQLLMKKGLLQTGIGSVNFQNVLEFIFQNSSSGTLWLGIIIYTLNFFIWIIILSRVDLSIALPVGSTSYIITPLLAMIFLHENISLMRWLGILLIVCGIYFVSESAHEKARSETQHG